MIGGSLVIERAAEPCADTAAPTDAIGAGGAGLSSDADNSDGPYNKQGSLFG
ncbi:hypothetical protein [Paenibacillus sp. Root444D2]|uniref:hypothetical protein n=1 Tax=Paenibacillus sp. Root444D2 TaxID=1736538 RepID=UPI000A661BFB|nr:hypothetical protein [Paenibacillus sp. Root444D2]